MKENEEKQGHRPAGSTLSTDEVSKNVSRILESSSGTGQGITTALLLVQVGDQTGTYFDGTSRDAARAIATFVTETGQLGEYANLFTALAEEVSKKEVLLDGLCDSLKSLFSFADERRNPLTEEETFKVPDTGEAKSSEPVNG